MFRHPNTFPGIPKRIAISHQDPNVPRNGWETRNAEMRVEGEGVAHPVLAIQAQQAVIAGEAMVTFYAAGQSIPMIKAGKIKAIAVNSDKRISELPAVPSEIEAGIDLPLGTFFGMLAPAATPKDVLMPLNTEINRILEDPKFSDLYAKRLGFRNANLNVDEFNAFLRQHRAEFEKFVRELGLEKK
ncbi:MAG: hypothetical protein EXR28_06205 [Betaproteobacteria bacterium]|nr:hypothetical protein [Betaproteobacteria bacterium]